MSQIVLRAVVAQLLLWPAAPALAQASLPPGASLANDVTALHAYKPTRNPGTTDFDATDRAAITNLLAAYAFAYDNFEAAAWLSLFTADAEFVAGEPGEPTVSFKGDGFRSFWTKRMDAFRSSGEQRRHLMANVLFLVETADTAHVSVVGLLTSTQGGKTFSSLSSLNYEGWLVKGADGWKIQRWHDFPDAAFSQ